MAAILLLSGCASFSPDGGFDKVAELTKERTGQATRWQRNDGEKDTAQARIAELLAQPLSADSAVELALLNNRGLQASFAELGIAESERVRAGRLANPTISFSHLSGGGITEIDRSVLFDVLGLITMPLAREAEARRFEAVQYRAAADAVGIAAEARRAFFEAVAAQVLLGYGLQVKDAADSSNELARRMAEAGNFSPLARMRQQAFDAEAGARLARARHQSIAARERLVRLLGLSGEQLAFELPQRLPDLPPEPQQPKDAEQTAMDKRLDVQTARRSTEATAKALGLSRATGFVNVLDAGYANKSQSGEARQNGYTIELSLPLFDFGAANVARAEASYMQSVHRTAQVAIDARSEVRESYSAYRTAYELARHYRDEVVPLAKRISDENQLRYNGMLISIFDLLADTREQIAGVSAGIEALRDYWLAETDLQSALTGGTPRAASAINP